MLCCYFTSAENIVANPIPEHQIKGLSFLLEVWPISPFSSLVHPSIVRLRKFFSFLLLLLVMTADHFPFLHRMSGWILLSLRSLRCFTLTVREFRRVNSAVFRDIVNLFVDILVDCYAGVCVVVLDEEDLAGHQEDGVDQEGQHHGQVLSHGVLHQEGSKLYCMYGGFYPGHQHELSQDDGWGEEEEEDQPDNVLHLDRA